LPASVTGRGPRPGRGIMSTPTFAPERFLRVARAAWAGLSGKASDADQAARWRDNYVRRLTKATTPQPRREAIAELLAEGLIASGGSDDFAGEDVMLGLWRWGESDGWERARDLTLLASPGPRNANRPKL
jgi:hypothetical protein